MSYLPKVQKYLRCGTESSKQKENYLHLERWLTSTTLAKSEVEVVAVVVDLVVAVVTSISGELVDQDHTDTVWEEPSFI